MGPTSLLRTLQLACRWIPTRVPIARDLTCAGCIHRMERVGIFAELRGIAECFRGTASLP